MRSAAILLFFFLTFSAFSQNEERIQYINEYHQLAIKEMKRTGIPASITLAQALLESNNGNSTLARKAKNHFGIKCHSDWDGRTIYHDDDRKGECFRVYPSVYASYHDHSLFLVHSDRYSFLFDLRPDDYKGWARGLKKAGYATDPRYARRLIQIIEDYELYQYDRGNRPQRSASPDNTIVQFDRQFQEVNGVQFIIARKGDTYHKLAKHYDMMPWEIYKYNDLPKDASITPGQRIFIQPKKNRAARGNRYHIAEEGETMYTIAQKYGIKLKKLYKKNPDIENGEVPKPGSKIWLRRKEGKGFLKRLFN